MTASTIQRAQRLVPRIRFIGGALGFVLPLAVAIALLCLAAICRSPGEAARTWLLLGALAAGFGAIIG
jgi:hypothetical protein